MPSINSMIIRIYGNIGDDVMLDSSSTTSSSVSVQTGEHGSPERSNDFSDDSVAAGEVGSRWADVPLTPPWLRRALSRFFLRRPCGVA
jgi:hypothetical protein